LNEASELNQKIPKRIERGIFLSFVKRFQKNLFIGAGELLSYKEKRSCRAAGGLGY
jgi:hypothetical protein